MTTPGVVGKVYILVHFVSDEDTTATGKASLKVENIDKDNVLYEDENDRSYEANSGSLFVFAERAPTGDDLVGDRVNITLNIDSLGGNSDAFFRVSQGSTLKGAHDHEFQPGITDTFEGGQAIPSQCEVRAGPPGNLESAGYVGLSGNEFEEDVDISGLIQEGQVNVVEISSATPGHIQAWVEGDIYRQITGGG